MNTLNEVKRLYGLGFSLIWLHPKSKRPIENGWTSGPKKTLKELIATYKDGNNVGVRTGSTSQLANGFLACIDVDVKDAAFKDVALQRLNELTGGRKLPEVQSGGGNGSRHLYCVTAKPFKMLIIEKHKEWEICVYSDGRQMVLPPSIHPSGRAYQWKHQLSEYPIMDFSEYFEQAKTEKKGQALGKEILEDFVCDDTLDIRWLPNIPDSTRLLIEHGTWRGKRVDDRSAYLLPAATGLVCAGLDKNTVLTVLTDPTTYLGKCAYEHAKTNSRKKAAEWLWSYTVKRVFAERSALAVFKKVAEYEPEVELGEFDTETQSEQIKDAKPWQQEIQRTKEGAAKTTLKNLDLILTHTFEEKLFVRDLFSNRDSYGDNTPWGGKKGQSLSDIDIIKIRRWFADTSFSVDPKKELTLDTVCLIADRNAVHPVRVWLDSLEWDGVPRIETWLKDYCQAEAPEPYLSEVSRLVLTAMCKRIFEPGCQWDYILVLEGLQGNYKSSTARALAGDAWFMDNLPDLRDKDAMLNLQGKWIIELGELASTKRADYDSVKAYLSRRTDTVRSPYGMLQKDIPRQSIFIGTVNEGQYLKDPTGNRRFWPVHVGVCNVDGIKAVRDQLFAEAMSHYRAFPKEPLMLNDEASVQAKKIQDIKRVEDDETVMRGSLLHFMEKQADLEFDAQFDFSRFRTKQLLDFPGSPWGDWKNKPYIFQTAAQVLQNIGFEKYEARGQQLWRKRSKKG